jgi:hypothetical protein
MPSFYSIANGCDSCSTVEPIVSNINMSMDPGAMMVAGLANTGAAYGQQYKQYMTQSGYPAGGSAGMVANMGIGSTMSSSCSAPNTMVAVQTQVPATAVSAVPAVAAQQQAATAVAAAKVAEASANAAVAAAKKTVAPVVEGFGSMGMDISGSANINISNQMMCFIVLIGVVFLAALACNECFRHFINRSLRMEDSWPYLYILYPAIMILVAVAVWTYIKRRL